MCNILDKNKQRRYIAFNHGNFKAWYTADHLKTLYAQTSKIYIISEVSFHIMTIFLWKVITFCFEH